MLTNMFLNLEGGQKLIGITGSLAYVAPQVLLGNYSRKIWAALLHVLLMGSLPF